MTTPNPAPTVYLIRHGEKPEPDDATLDIDVPDWRKSSDDIEQARKKAWELWTDLTERGKQRAAALVNVFGHGSPYGIGYIIAQTPGGGDESQRPTLTVTPLAESLGLKDTTEFNTDITVDEIGRVVQAVASYIGKGNILICWEHKRLIEIARSLGVKNLLDYPGHRFDLIYTIKPLIDKTTGLYTYDSIDSISSQGCDGLDDVALGKVPGKDTGKAKKPDAWTWNGTM